MKNNKLYKTYAEARVASLIDPNDKTLALANFVTKSLGYNFLPQVDLLYIRSVHVTAGVNANDDVFFVDELWNARYTPILKPLNIEHNEKDIVGVLFNVSARDLSKGELVDLNSENYKNPFEIITEGVIYKLLFPDKAEEIKVKAQNNQLFVSMEAWFEDYDYVILDKNGEIEKIIAHNSDTGFLDQYLKAFGGKGLYIDSESNEEKRIARGLRKIIFGGQGIVKFPANSRSVIEDVGNSDKNISLNNLNDDEIHDKLINLINKLDKIVENEELYASVANSKEVEMTDKVAKDEINAALDERDAKKKAEAELNFLKQKAERADILEKENKELNEKIKSAEANEVQKSNDIANIINETIKIMDEKKINSNIKLQSANDAWDAKIVWFKNTMSFLINKAADCENFENQIKEAKLESRFNEVKAMFKDIMGDEEIQVFINKVKAMDDASYDDWKKEKEILLAKIIKPEEKKEEEKEEEKATAKKEEDVDSKILEDLKAELHPNITAASCGDGDNPDGMSEAVAFIYSVDVAEDTGKNKSGSDPDNE